MTHQASDEFIENQNLGDQVKIFVHQKAYSLRKEMQERKDAEKWFKENMNYNMDYNRSTMYNKIQCGNLQEGVKKIVLEMFHQRIGKPFQ